MNRKLLSFLLILAIVFSLSSCGKKNKIKKEEFESAASLAVTGGWTLSDPQDNILPEEVSEAFDDALEGYTGVGFKPVAYLGSQVVAGLNYAVLCQGTTVTADPDTSLKVVIIYKDLEGNSQINRVNDFNITDFTVENSSDKTSVTGLAGGWSYASAVPTEFTDDRTAAAFDNAFKRITGVKYEPLALLGTQVVSGTNYAFLCKATTVTKEPVSVIKVVAVYQDLQGNSAITSIKDVDISDFNN